MENNRQEESRRIEEAREEAITVLPGGSNSSYLAAASLARKTESYSKPQKKTKARLGCSR